jgi:hypothetical protein
MASSITTSKGVRLDNNLWKELTKLALSKNLLLNEYVALVLDEHVKGSKIKK